MRTRRVRGTALLVTAVTLVLAAGCSKGGGAATDASDEQATLTVGVVPALDSAGFFIAYYEGLFKAQGLTIIPKFVTSSETAIALQVKGQYQITGGNYVSYIQAQQAGEANLNIFAEGSVMEPGAQDLYTMPNSQIRSLGDLRGRTIAINAPDNILYLLAASVLTEHGIPPRTCTSSPLTGFLRCPPNSMQAPSTRPCCPNPSPASRKRATAPCRWPT